MRSEIVRSFIKRYPELVQSMKDCDHAPKGELSPFHGEGSVWTHTMMVMEWIDAKYSDRILLFAGLLHDIGKPDAQEFVPASNDKPNRYRFSNHESLSTFKAIQILKEMKDEFELKEFHINQILKIISLHGSFLENEDEILLSDLKKFREGDKNGAIRINENELIMSQYQPRKYIKRDDRERTQELIMAVGLPNSGKSTYFNDVKYKDYYILSRDNDVQRFFIAQNGYEGTYNEAFEYTSGNKEFEDYFKSSINFAKGFDKVIIDMTMMSLKSRRKMISEFPNHLLECKVFMTDLETIKEREEKRSKEGKIIPKFVYKNMMKSFIMPILDEGFNKIDIIFS